VPQYLDALTSVIEDVVEPNAREVDQEGGFPQEGIDALAKAGLLGLAITPEPAASDRGGPAEAGLAAAAQVVERLAQACGSTAMVVLMHYAASALVDAHGDPDVRASIAGGEHVTTLAFSEAGSRSHFWAPLGTATPSDDSTAMLDASKSWVTSAANADSYVWSSRPLAADGPMTLWLVPAGSDGLSLSGPFDGLGLRGNGSVPVKAAAVVVPRAAMLGADGAGLDIALAVALPWFLILSAAFSVGLMEAVTQETGRHLTATQLEHLSERLIDQPLTRVDYARMRLQTDTARALLTDTLNALGTGREDAMLRVLEVKAGAAEAAIAVTDLAMKLCGGAAFRKEVGIERRFRDARAARVMAPTTDALLDFVGRAISGMALL
jgi:alkylation response protein AidB-like acyl-CoA dehydrogenase